MASSRSVNLTIWADDWFSDLKRDEKLLFLYLLTNPLTRLSGAYKIGLRQISFDTGIPTESAEKMLERFNSQRKVIYRNGWLVLLNFLHHQKYNDNMMKCVLTELSDSPAFVSNAVATVIKNSERLGKAFEPFGTLPFKREVEVEVEREVERECEQTSSTKAEGQSVKESVAHVFDFWKKTFNHPKSKLDTKREARIRARLKDGFSVEDLRSVCEGVTKSAFHMGDNADGKIYDGIETIYRDVAQVEKFIELSKIEGSRANGKQQRTGSKTLDTINEWEKEHQRIFGGGNLPDGNSD